MADAKESILYKGNCTCIVSKTKKAKGESTSIIFIQRCIRLLENFHPNKSPFAFGDIIKERVKSVHGRILKWALGATVRALCLCHCVLVLSILATILADLVPLSNLLTFVSIAHCFLVEGRRTIASLASHCTQLGPRGRGRRSPLLG